VKVRECIVEPCERGAIKDFVEKWHYSRSINGVKSKYCFRLMYNGELIGAAIFAEPATKGVDKHYSATSPKAVVELRRLCCINNTPKNTESFFIGHCLRWLHHNTDLEKCVSYSDLTYGHEGTIYKASNFKLVGQVAPQKLVKLGNRLYHDRCLRVRYKDDLKPFAKKLKAALDSGQAEIVMSKEKNIYVYDLNPKHTICSKSKQKARYSKEVESFFEA
jgi:hypothetical protein